jgi:hypothetical protein
LGERIVRLAAVCREEDITLQELVDRMEGRSFILLTFLISLPFCQPVPMLGLSTPLGSLLAYFGWRMMLGKELRLPKRFQQLVIPKKFFPLLLSGAGRLLRWLERHLRRQWSDLVQPEWVKQACGANIVLCAVLLALPLPIPFSNVFPALPIALSAAALLESDGKMLIRAAAAAAVNAIFWITWIVLIAIYGWPVVETVETTVRGWLGF